MEHKDPYIGKMLDNRYEILERIGTGGMAVVYKAKCHRLNRLVAVKILKSDLAQDEDFRRRFNAESQAVAQLSHPNIVSVYDVSRGGDTEYIVMELIDGITPEAVYGEAGPAELAGVPALHHPDHAGPQPRPQPGHRPPGYQAPERHGAAGRQREGGRLRHRLPGKRRPDPDPGGPGLRPLYLPGAGPGDRTDARSDIYSAGVVLYEMLTGRLPFEGDSAVSVAIQHLSSVPLAPREMNPDIPEQLELICMKAMAGVGGGFPSTGLEKRYPSQTR